MLVINKVYTTNNNKTSPFMQNITLIKKTYGNERIHAKTQILLSTQFKTEKIFTD